MRNIKMMTVDNIDEFLKCEWPLSASTNITEPKHKRGGGENNNTGRKKIKLSITMQALLSKNLQERFAALFEIKYPNGTMFAAEDLFGTSKIDQIIKKFGTFEGINGLRKTIGGQTIPGQLKALVTTINNFITGPLAQEQAVGLGATTNEARAKQQPKDQAATRAAKLLKDEEKRKQKEIEKQQEIKEQAIHLAMLIRLAGKEAEPRGVASIHRGRHTNASASGSGRD
jgi:hypothetical protein